jgi:hypothetical protein
MNSQRRQPRGSELWKSGCGSPGADVLLPLRMAILKLASWQEGGRSLVTPIGARSARHLRVKTHCQSARELLPSVRQTLLRDRARSDPGANLLGPKGRSGTELARRSSRPPAERSRERGLIGIAQIGGDGGDRGVSFL